jgi:hypothetical protein
MARPWAISALRSADYYELDCSFHGLRPYVYSIPLEVKANVGITLAIMIAPSERREVFSVFADLLTQKGFSQKELLEMPLLSDAGTAPRSYAQEVAGCGGYRRHYYFCYRHLLEALGSDTLVALFARRLLFPRTENAYKKDYLQAVVDFVLGCHQGMISDRGHEKSGKLFGVDLTRPDGSGPPDSGTGAFRDQALWDERGINFGVVAH